jgi:hypothetical protein
MQPKKLGKYLMGACALFLMGNNVWAAQTVKYSIRWDYNADRYRVYMMPTATPAGTYGDQTLTSQVTVRVTHKTGAQRFDMADLVAKVDKTMWTGDEDEARVDAPTEKPDMDYISMELGIKGTDRSIFHWQANQEQEVFSFVNAAGCIGTVEIMPDDDPFDPKNIASGRNSSGTNPGNQITNLGWGTAKDNNFLSVYGAPADCTLSNDTDHDGLKDGQEKEIVGSPYDNPDYDGDGKLDGAEVGADIYHPTDTDGDSIPDWKESAITDTDKDGIVDELDPDNNNACVPSVKAGACDQDGDGKPNSTDTDDDGDGVSDTVETALGTDPNDADSDNTNTPSVNEGTAGVQQGKSASDDSTTDTDGDGKTDATECSPLTASGACKDTDGDGIPDWKESAITDTDKDGTPDELDKDNNNACVPDVKAATCDLDGDGIPNSTDTDADGDGVPNTVETALGTDPYDADSDNTNTPSVNEGTAGVQQGKSASDDSTTDTDGDGKTNAAECSPLTASGACKDTDGDGIPDWQESAIIDTDKDGIVDELDPDNNTPIAVNVQVKVMLQGPYDSASGTMQDTLRSKGLIPTAQPYNNSSFLYTGTETASASLLASTDSHNAPVDWVLVELRDASKPYTVLASKAALVQRDGDVMDAATGSTNLSFTKMQPGNYYVSVRHRNHLGAMTQKAMSLAPSPVTAVDFSNPATLTWGSNARLSSSSISLLWSGNADMNWYAIASGPGNDTTTVLFSIWGAAGNTTGSTNYILPGYASTDFNLDGRTIYSGNGNDVNILLANVLLHPGNGSLSANYIITQQIPIAP